MNAVGTRMRRKGGTTDGTDDTDDTGEEKEEGKENSG